MLDKAAVVDEASGEEELAVNVKADFAAETSDGGSVNVPLSATFVQEVVIQPGVRGSIVTKKILFIPVPIGVQVNSTVDINAVVDNCVSYAVVEGIGIDTGSHTRVSYGGIVGAVRDRDWVYNCYNVGKVVSVGGNRATGAIVGWAEEDAHAKAVQMAYNFAYIWSDCE